MPPRHWPDLGSKNFDRDGLSDEFETNVVGTDPKKRETDGDGNDPSATENLDGLE